MKIIKNDLFKLSRASGAIKIGILVKKYVFLQDMSSRRPLTDQNKPFFIFFRIFDQNVVDFLIFFMSISQTRLKSDEKNKQKEEA